MLDLRDSVIYQKLLREGRAEGRAEGRIEEARKIAKRQAIKRFGKTGPRFEAAVDALDDLEELELLVERVLDAEGWEDLIGEEASGRAGPEENPSA